MNNSWKYGKATYWYSWSNDSGISCETLKCIFILTAIFSVCINKRGYLMLVYNVAGPEH